MNLIKKHTTIFLRKITSLDRGGHFLSFSLSSIGEGWGEVEIEYKINEYKIKRG